MSEKGNGVAASVRTESKARLKALRGALAKEKADALLVTDLKNARYLTGFTGSNAFVIVTESKAFLLTDSRYATQASLEVKGYGIKIITKAIDAIAGLVASLKIKTLAFEAANVTCSTHSKLGEALPKVKLKPTTGIVGRLRVKKDSGEIERLRASARLLDTGYRDAMRLIRPGVVERDAALSIEMALRRRGADGLAFDTIIASGPRGALPHGKASHKLIKKGEFVVVDMGVLMDGYNSDETRTFVVGKATVRHKEIYGIVKGAQAKALEAVKPGIKAGAVDAAARDHIKKAGYGKYFGHGTGHGVGLDIHEGPSIAPGNEEILEEGMVLTVEPGIYMPGWGGVRIEDMALVTKGGYELLTNTGKDLIAL